MKELGNWIPQIFYDLIGRVAPGAFLLLLGRGLLAASSPENQIKGFPNGLSTQIIAFPSELSTTEAIAIGLVMSYMIGVILGALGYIFLDEHLFTNVASISADVPDSLKSSDMTDGQISFLYDAVQFYDPSAGARLAKLRAEQHMCSVLLVGGYLLLVAYIIKVRGEYRLFVVAGLIAIVIAARAFYLHLDVRARRLLVNYCRLIKELHFINSKPGGPPSVQVTNQAKLPGESLPPKQPERLPLWKRFWLLLWWRRGRDGAADSVRTESADLK